MLFILKQATTIHHIKFNILLIYMCETRSYSASALRSYMRQTQHNADGRCNRALKMAKKMLEKNTVESEIKKMPWNFPI